MAEMQRRPRFAQVPAGSDRGAVRRNPGLHEHLAEGRMGAVRSLGINDNLAIAGHLDPAQVAAGVADRQPRAFGIGLGRDDQFQMAFNRAHGFQEFGLVVGKNCLRHFAGRRFGRRRGRPPRASIGVAQEYEIAVDIAGWVGPPAGDRHIANPRPARPARGQHFGIMPVRQKPDGPVGMGRVVDDRLAALAGCSNRQPVQIDLRCPRDRHNFARGLFLQQQFRRLHDRIGMKPVAVNAVHHRIGHGDDDHPLMMRHHRPHNHMRNTVGQPVPAEIDRVEIAMRPQRPQCRQPRQIAHRLARGDLGGQNGRIGGDHMIRAATAFQGQFRHAKGIVLIGHLGIPRVHRRFRQAPGPAGAARLVDLGADGGDVGLVQHTARPFLHHQNRHQVFEHRA